MKETNERNKETKKQRKKGGITLISLVITIIVLLILAGITINLTIGEDGILKRAEEAGKTYKNAETNELAYLNDFEASVIPGKVARTEKGVQYVGDGMGNLIPVPVGFSYLEGTKNTGFVIKNDNDGNEFVWVPCTIDGANGSIKYARYAFYRKGWEASQILNDVKGEIIRQDEETYIYKEAMPNEEQNSIKIYGGFYIGRYEAGIEAEEQRTETSDALDDIVIQKDKNVYSYISFSDAKNNSEKLYTKENNNVTSKLCSSYAWDTALKFIEIQNSGYPTNSIGGNYKETKFTHKDINGQIQTKQQNVATIVLTGQTTSVNNIYDMGGNVWEWVTETVSTNSKMYYSHRGGNAYDSATSHPAGYRYRSEDEVYKGNGFRVTLFL